ncbi:THAP domain-containing protein 2-like [Ptychodera flava]|uniref:THAP domain-containing protein 2-like n=1 Tax=Ptychodera flava TaxID=63121 RepID=UPI00396A08AC
MPNTCVIYGCYNRSNRGVKRSYHSIPKIIETQGEQTKILSTKRREKWIAAIGRKDWIPSVHSKVCSEHFLTGRPSALYSQTHPDWVPSLKLGEKPVNVSHTPTGSDSLDRNQWQLNRGVENHNIVQPAEELHYLVVLETNSSPSLELEVEDHHGNQKRIPPVSTKDGVFTVTSPPSEDHLYCKTDVDEVSSVCVATQTEITGSHLLQVKEENLLLQQRIHKLETALNDRKHYGET